MQKYPGHGGGYKEHYFVEEVVEEEVVEDFSLQEDYQYNHGSSMQMKPAGDHHYFNPHPKHNVNEYEYDNYGFDNVKGGRDGHRAQYPEARYQKEQYSNPWNRRNDDYSDYGGKRHDAYHKYQSQAPAYNMGMVDGGYIGGGYGRHRSPQHDKGYGEEKPFWNTKAIRD